MHSASKARRDASRRYWGIDYQRYGVTHHVVKGNYYITTGDLFPNFSTTCTMMFTR
jgi:hypothetical protein